MRWPDTTTSLTAADWILWDFMNKRLNNGMTFNQLMSMEKVWKSKPIAVRDVAYCNKKAHACVLSGLLLSLTSQEP
jgi:hypothetical protein